jgi:hypothetical protein
MANGILGSVDLAATTYTEFYEVPTETFAVVTVAFTNKTTSTIEVRLAATKPENSSTPEADDYLEYNAQILPGGVLERSGVVLEAGRRLFAHSDSANTVAMVYGIETPTA